MNDPNSIIIEEALKENKIRILFNSALRHMSHSGISGTYNSGILQEIADIDSNYTVRAYNISGNVNGAETVFEAELLYKDKIIDRGKVKYLFEYY